MTVSVSEAQIVFAKAMIDAGFYLLTVFEQLESDLKRFSDPGVDPMIEASRKAIIRQKRLIKSFKGTLETAIRLQEYSNG